MPAISRSADLAWEKVLPTGDFAISSQRAGLPVCRDRGWLANSRFPRCFLPKRWLSSIETRSLSPSPKKQGGQRKKREKSFSAGKGVSEAFHESSRRMHWMSRRRKGNPTKEERRQEPAKRPPNGLFFHRFFSVRYWRFMKHKREEKAITFLLGNRCRATATYPFRADWACAWRFTAASSWLRNS